MNIKSGYLNGNDSEKVQMILFCLCLPVAPFF